MKTLIAYYSKTGKTEKVALDLAKLLNADLEKIIDQKKRTGLVGYLTGGRDAMKKKLTQINSLSKNPADYDLVILGMPVWGWNLTPALRTYIEENKNKIKKYAFFVTSGDTPAEKLIKYFVEIFGQEPICQTGFNTKELSDENIYQQKINDLLIKINN
ncbi:MAG TPA: flavodoxin [bacterium]|nr:flavodoxin [bacterium]